MIRLLFIMVCLDMVCWSSSCSPGPHGAAQVWRNPKDDMRFVWVPAGSLAVEVPSESSEPNEAGETSPQVVAFRDGFWLGRTEVTIGQFRRFAMETGFVTEAERAGNQWTWRHPGFPQKDDHPAVYLSYKDSLQYARWAGVDLPTEAEWLYACKAGANTVFYWGNELDGRYVWHRGNTEGTGTRPVARKLPNAWGLHDMVGNAREYCKVGETCFATRGGAWTRCPAYRSRTGSVNQKLLDAEVEPRLHKCDPAPQYPPYAWDDDRGFRCIRRVASGQQD